MSGRRRKRRWNPRFLALCGILAVLTAAVTVTAVVKYRGRSPGEAEENLPEYVQRELLTVNEWSRPGEALVKVRGVVIHYVGNPGTTAEANRNYFESLSAGTDGVYASSHFIVGLEGEVIQCVPMTEIAYASNSRNGDTISVEVCHPDGTGEYGPETYGRVVELTAWLCREFRLDPERDVIRHYDVSGKLCPLYYVEHEAAWEQLLADTAAELERLETAEKNS